MSGDLRVALPRTFGALPMGDVVDSFVAQHPNLNVEIVDDDRYIDFHLNAIDVAIRIGQLPDSQNRHGQCSRSPSPCTLRP